MSKPGIIPIFIPHEGCPHCCVFCNQTRITGQDTRITVPEIRNRIRSWLEHYEQLKKKGRPIQVAFYGGSFTALPARRQEELLAEANRWLQQGAIQAIRLSTRPDCIDRQILARLARYRVSIVELGIQSLDDRVLAAAGRGHSSADSRRAILLLRQNGFTVGAQLMLGLPGESRISLEQTTRELIRLKPDFVRIYPLLVLRGSRLEPLYRQGIYRPLSLAKAIVLATIMQELLAQAGIPVIRIGLQAGMSLENSVLAGPYHPAFGELVQARRLLHNIRGTLASLPDNERATLLLSNRDRSLVHGHGGCLLRRLRKHGLGTRFTLEFRAEVGRFQVVPGRQDGP